jgi:hypothetical protein
LRGSFARFALVALTSLALIAEGHHGVAIQKLHLLTSQDLVMTRTYTFRHCRFGFAHKSVQHRQSSKMRTFGRPHMRSRKHQDWQPKNGHNRHFGPVLPWQFHKPMRKLRYARA